jgi:argonaute-like protein implicated in RNA metabolism and viral defense
MNQPRVEFMNGMDERLKYVLESVKKAVEMFLKATKDMEYACRFKAFEMMNVTETDKNALSEVIKEAFAIEIGYQAKDTLDSITYGYHVEAVEGEESKYSFWFNAVKEKPVYPEKEELAVVEEVKEEEEAKEETNEILLPHA